MFMWMPLAASIASVIAMAGDTIYMPPKNSMLMIHNPWIFAWGNASEMRKIADDLDRIGNSSKQVYLQKAGDKLSDEKLQDMLDAETWLSADEAFEYGLCDVVQEANTTSISE
nr:head maturation protease, ClpP-related [Paenibacillus larvae]